MAYITIVSGGAQPVFATDVRNGNPAQTANLAAGGPVNFAGPKLDFFGLTANSSLAVSGAGNAAALPVRIVAVVPETAANATLYTEVIVKFNNPQILLAAGNDFA